MQKSIMQFQAAWKKLIFKIVPFPRVCWNFFCTDLGHLPIAYILQTLYFKIQYHSKLSNYVLYIYTLLVTFICFQYLTSINLQTLNN